MSDSTPMTPDQARETLATWPTWLPPGSGYRALEIIANMTVEVEYRIVPADSNGGKYETRRWTRHVTEWAPDVAS